MSSLPIVDPTALTSGDLPVRSVDDVRALLPAKYKRASATEAPVREAMLSALTSIAFEWQRRAAHAAGQADPVHATERYLQGLGDDRIVFQPATEPQEAYRSRMLAPPSLVVREAILTICDTALLPYTAIKARAFESILDRMYVDDGVDHTFHVFIDGPDQVYLDRFYPDDEIVNGAVRRQSASFGAWAFLDSVGRHFVIQLPDISPIADTRMFVYGAPFPDEGDVRAYISDGTNPSGSEVDGSVISLVSLDLQTALDTYQSIADSITGAVGHSIRWSLIVEPDLV